MPWLSVIIPTYNRASFLIRALESVLNQSFRDQEILIVDDGSTDGTQERITTYLQSVQDTKVYYLKQRNQGVAAARNYGVAHASGSWIAFLDSDDSWLPEKIALQREYLQLNPSLGLLHCQERWIRSGQEVKVPAIYRKYGGEVFLHSLPRCMIGPSTVLIKKKLFDETGGFNPDFPVCEDYDLWLRMTSQYPVGLIPRELILKYGGHNDQLSTAKAMDYWRIKALCGILATGRLNKGQQMAVYEQIDQKARILLKGYQKYGHGERTAQVLAMIRNVYPDFLQRD